MWSGMAEVATGEGRAGRVALAGLIGGTGRAGAVQATQHDIAFIAFPGE